jgi:hypothetical protein
MIAKDAVISTDGRTDGLGIKSPKSGPDEVEIHSVGGRFLRLMLDASR